jgi:hypothetical protein
LKEVGPAARAHERIPGGTVVGATGRPQGQAIRPRPRARPAAPPPSPAARAP